MLTKVRYGGIILKNEYKGIDEECANISPLRELAVGASHRSGVCICSFRAGGKKAVRQVEPSRDCCVKA